MGTTELRMSFADQAALARELDSNLRHGRAFILGAGGVEALIDCVLVLVHPTSGHEIGLRGQVVMVSDAEPVRGIGIQLRPFDANVLRMLQAFVDGDPAAVGTAELSRPEPETGERASDASAREAVPEAEAEGGAEADGLQLNGDGDLEGEAGEEAHGDLYTDADADADADADGDDEAEGDGEGLLAGEATSSDDADGDVEDLLGGGESEDGDAPASDLQQGPARHARMRKLSVTQQYKVARFGELNDRVMLERIYSKAVWEPLLQNPKLTLPEVARIARKGSAPRPLIEQIVENNAWVQSPLVRRALLTNPRVSGEGILKLLRMTPRPELKVICKTTTYSTQVREAARKVLES
jgi:hypothetical protein